MRILHVIARMNVGGTATYLANLIRGLEVSGVENLLVFGNVPKGETEDSVISTLKCQRIVGLSRELSFSHDRKARIEIEAAIEKYMPDIIHTHTFKAGFLVRLKKRRTPVVHSFHGHHLYDPEFNLTKRTFLNFLEQRLARRAMFLVTIGRRIRDELLDAGIGSPSQYVSIAPGIAPIELVRREDVRRRLGCVGNEISVVWMGRFTKVKRPDRVIEIARLIPEAKFIMAGDGEILNEVTKVAPSNVIFVGFQDRNDMWSIADVALCTSDSEGMPLALIEAQMAGVPVVSTDVGSVSEIVLDGVTGRLGSRSSEDLARKLRWVIAEIRGSDAMSKAAREHATREFSSDVMVMAHINLYRKVLDKVSA